MNWLQEAVDPMLAKLISAIPEGDYLYEVKWDGIRAIITLENNQVQIHSRNKNDISRQFPELLTPEVFRADNGIFDVEIVSLDKDGKPSFQKIIHRLKTTNEEKIQRRSESSPVRCYAFDCLYINRQPIIQEPLTYRREQLQSAIREVSPYYISETIEDGEALFKAAREHGLEGIIAKKKDGRYYPGNRSDLWQKIKVRHTEDYLVIGYTKGQGDRSNYFGALHLAEAKSGKLIYRGKVGTGFSDVTLKEVYSELTTLSETAKPAYAEQSKDTVWVEPKLVAEVSYSNITNDGYLRAPVFHRLRPDKII